MRNWRLLELVNHQECDGRLFDWAMLKPSFNLARIQIAELTVPHTIEAKNLL